MIIGTIAATSVVSRVYNVLPFVWAVAFVYNTTSTYWTTVFGAPAESQISTVNVLGVTINETIYSEVTSLADCLVSEGSFYFDTGAQELYIHVVHSVEPMSARVSYGKAIGFSDNDVVSINGFEYLPLIESTPAISQQQDIVNYDKLALINGDVILRNTGGILDYLKYEKIIGNDFFLAYLPDSKIINGEASGNDVVPLAGFYVEDYEDGVQKYRLNLQDKRKAQDASLPATRFAVADYPNLDDDSVDIPIAVAYGYLRELKAYPTNGKASSTTVRYRAALLLTALTTVYLKINDKWTVSTASNIDLTTGEFDVAGAKSGTTAAPYECKVECTGIANTYASDVIKDLNNRYASVAFVASYYDLLEWAQEETQLSTIGIAFTDEVKLFDAIRQIQNGCNVGFRYEINAQGKRTIRIDDENRARLPSIDNVEILDAIKINVISDTQFLAAQVRVGYQKSFESGKFLTTLNNTYYQDVVENFRTRQEVRFDTWLTTLVSAQTRATALALKYNSLIETCEVTLMGEQYLTLRIFDVMPIAITPDPIDLDTAESEGRTYYGVQHCKIIAISPDFKRRVNKVKVELLGPITPSFVKLIVAADGVTRIISASGLLIRSGGQ
jgi:hypothetical protein